MRQKFTGHVGTLFERSKIPLHKWVFVAHLLASSEKGVSAHQLHRLLGITYKSAWLMAHRIRESMCDINPGPKDGEVRIVHTPFVTAATLRPILVEQLEPATKLCTDDAGQYRHMHRDFDYEVVNHSANEYVRGDDHTNTVENYFSILKRGITGVYQAVSAKHLKRYLGEFDFRYNTRDIADFERAALAMKLTEGMRVTYRRTDARA